MHISTDKHLHIIAFNIPYPPDYGGVIDIYYKVKALAEKGIKIHLHCFQYDRPPAKDLEKLCDKVSYYKRKSIWRSFFSLKPYIVNSRRDKELLYALLRDDHPILFEGLHTCYYLGHPNLKKRIKLVRLHNIESRYYHNLFLSSTYLFRKAYFVIEAARLLFYEGVLGYAQHLLPISPDETAYYKGKFKEAAYLPPFHAEQSVSACTGRGQYVLYHGDLNIRENKVMVRRLIRDVFRHMGIPFVIAGRNAAKAVGRLAAKHKYIRVEGDLADAELDKLIQEAHVNLLPALYKSGFKLKLLKALYAGRFCVANSLMVKNTGLEELCIVADTPAEIQNALTALFQKEFKTDDIQKRKAVLDKHFANGLNAENIRALIALA